MKEITYNCFDKGISLSVKERQRLIYIFYRHFRLRRLINSLIFELSVMTFYIIIVKTAEGEWFRYFRFQQSGYAVIYAVFLLVVIVSGQVFKRIRTSAKVVRRLAKGEFVWRTVKVTDTEYNKNYIILNGKEYVLLVKDEKDREIGDKYFAIMFPDFLKKRYAAPYDDVIKNE